MAPAEPQPLVGGHPATVSTKDRALPHWLVVFGWIGPLIIFLINKDKAQVREESAKALNWTLVTLIAAGTMSILAWVMALMAMSTAMSNNISGVMLWVNVSNAFNFVAFGIWIGSGAFGVMNALRLNKGRPAQYPITVKWVK